MGCGPWRSLEGVDLGLTSGLGEYFKTMAACPPPPAPLESEAEDRPCMIAGQTTMISGAEEVVRDEDRSGGSRRVGKAVTLITGKLSGSQLCAPRPIQKVRVTKRERTARI